MVGSVLGALLARWLVARLGPARTSTAGVAGPVLAGAAVAVAMVAALTALHAQRVADRTPPAETLRLGT